MFRLPKMRVKQFCWAQIESTPRTLLYTLGWGRNSKGKEEYSPLKCS